VSKGGPERLAALTERVSKGWRLGNARQQLTGQEGWPPVDAGSSGQQLAEGQLVAGRYRVQSLIGRGGMAEVYRSLDERLARPVALKVLRSHFASDPALRARFEEEARAAAMVSHPNVVGVFDAGEDGDRAFIVMELVTGETLADRIARGPLDEGAVRRIGGEVLDALAAAHARGVLHRDIKPANVLISDEDGAKVADFGIAKAVHPSPDTASTTREMVLGTPGYLPPERAEGRPATVASDLWSVGVLLYEAITGERPYPGDNAVAVTLAAREGRHEPLERLRPGTDPGLAAVVERALQADPAARFATATEMATALRNPVAPPTVILAPGTPFAHGPRDTQPLALAGAAGAVAAGVAAAAGTAAAAGPPTGSAGTSGPMPAWTGRPPASPRGPRRHRPPLAPLLGAAAAVVLVAGLLALAIANPHHVPVAGTHRLRPPPSTTKLDASTTTTTTTTTQPPPTTAPPATPPTTAPPPQPKPKPNPPPTTDPPPSSTTTSTSTTTTSTTSTTTTTTTQPSAGGGTNT